MGVTAANVPSFRGQTSLSLGDLQDLVEVVKALMLQSDAPPGRVRVGSAKAVPAHDPPEGGVYFEGKFYGKNTYFRPRPGLVQDLAFQEGLKEPCFLHGHGLLPLAQSAESSGVDIGSAVAGGIAGIRYAPELSAPRIAPGGIIELPPGGGGTAPVPLAQWDQQGGNQVPGLVQLLTLESVYEKPAAYGGQIYFPLAATVDASGIDRPSAVAGAIAGIRYADPSAVAQSSVGSGVGSGVEPVTQAPRILPGGIIELPRPDGALQGIVDGTGSSVDWTALSAIPGGKMVASYQLPTPLGNLPVFLYVGIQNGFLSFSLSDST